MNARKLVLLTLAAALPLFLMRWTRADDPASAKAPDKAAAGDPNAPPANPAPPPRDEHGPRDTRGPRDDQGPPDEQRPRGPQRGGERSRARQAPRDEQSPRGGDTQDFPGPGGPGPVLIRRGDPNAIGAGRLPPGAAGDPNAMYFISRDPQAIERGDPEMFKLFQQEAELDRQTRQLAGEYRQAPQDKQDEVKKKLQETVAKHFEVRQQRRTMELKRLESELTRLRDSIEKRNQEKQQIIDRRVSELLGQEDNQF